MIRSKNIPLCTEFFNKFIQEFENQFTFSNCVSDVLTLNTSSAVTIMSIFKSDKSSFDIIGGVLYACNPIYGVVVPLLYINSNYQGRNIGSTLLEVLQKFTWTILLSTRIFVWFTNNENSELLSFYRKLKFHSAHSSCYSFVHTFPSTIINAINDIDSSEYLLERSKIEYETNIKFSHNTKYPCEICGYKSLLNMICKHKLPKTKIAMSSGSSSKKNTQANICGICLCRTYNSRFGVNVYSNHCVFHPPNTQQKQKKQEKEQNEVQKIKHINHDNLQRVKESPQLFFNSVYEKFDLRATEFSCRHYFLNNKKVEYSFFQQCSTLKSKEYRCHINNINNIFNVMQMKANHLFDEYNFFSSNVSNTKNTLYFDEYIHRPATLL